MASPIQNGRSASWRLRDGGGRPRTSSWPWNTTMSAIRLSIGMPTQRGRGAALDPPRTATTWWLRCRRRRGCPQPEEKPMAFAYW